MVNVAVTNAVQVVDLTTFPQTAALPATTVKGSEHLNPLGQYLTIIPDGACFIQFASTAAALAAITTTDTNTISALGVITANNKCTVQLTGGVKYDFRLPPGPTGSSSAPGLTNAWGAQSAARFFGVLTASGTTTLRCWVSSR